MAKQNKYTPYESTSGAFAADNVANATIQSKTIVTGGTAVTITPTTGTHLVRLTANADFWYEFTNTAVVESTDKTSGASVYVAGGVAEYVQIPEGETVLSVNSSQTGAMISALFWD